MKPGLDERGFRRIRRIRRLGELDDWAEDVDVGRRRGVLLDAAAETLVDRHQIKWR